MSRIKIVSILFGFAITLVACATQLSDPDPTTSSSDQDLRGSGDGDGGCCSGGELTCSNGYEIDYDTPRCGPLTHTQALNICNSHCPTACHDSGWISSCQ